MKLGSQFLSAQACLLLVLALLGGCASDQSQTESVESQRETADLFLLGRYEEALAKIEKQVQENPKNFNYRTQLVNRRAEAVRRLLAVATTEMEASRAETADATYRRILRIDPTNERAKQGLVVTARQGRNNELLEQAKEAVSKGDLEKAQLLVQSITPDSSSNRDLADVKRSILDLQSRDAMASPALNAAFKKPISLEFRDANLKVVFEVLSRTTEINFILDREIKPDQKTTLFLKQTTLADAVDLLLVTNQLEKKILNANSILIYPSTPAKIKEYQDLVVKSFYMANADVKQTLNMIKTMLKTKDVYVEERLNMLVMRDTPEAIRLAEKLVAMQDMAEPEVMLEVEVLEIKRSRLVDLGINFPNQLTLTPLPSASNNSTIIGPAGTTTTNSTAGALTLADLNSLNATRLGAAISPLVINLKSENGTVNLLANPRIRARNREIAKILIGDKVPVITTTSTAAGFLSESVQYVDVGLKLEVEPNIYLKDDVAIKVALEVSSIVREVRSSSGSLSYQIGTRNVSTLLRLKDGETQVLAGLISDEARSSTSKVPGLGDLPIAGRLFSNQGDNSQKTEIVLSITPRLIRNLQRSGAEEFWSGTDATLRTRQLGLQPLAEGSAITAGASPAAPMVAAVSSSTLGAQNASVEGSFSWEGPAQVKQGQLFRMTLKLKTDGTIGGLPFQMGYDPRSIELVDISEGEFFKQGKLSGNFTSNVEPGGGKLTIDTSSPDADGAKGEGTLVNVTFKAIAPAPKTEIKLLSASGVSIPLPKAHVLSISAN